VGNSHTLHAVSHDSRTVTSRFPQAVAMRPRSLVQVNLFEWWASRNVFGLFDCLFEPAVQQFGFHLLLFGALFEEAFSALSFLFEELGSMIQVGGSGGSWGRLVEENLTQLGVHFEPRPAVWTYDLCRFVLRLIHLDLL